MNGLLDTIPPYNPDPCRTCEGTGKVDTNTCPACGGSGESRREGGRDWLD